MIATLVRRDIALKGVFYTWLLLSLFVGIILAGVGRISRLDPGSTTLISPADGPVIIYAMLISWLLLSLYLGPAEVADHANRMTISLPVPAKKVWLSRVLALVIAETVLFIVTGLVIALVNLITGSPAVFPTYLANFLFQQFCCILLLIMIILLAFYLKLLRHPYPGLGGSWCTLVFPDTIPDPICAVPPRWGSGDFPDNLCKTTYIIHVITPNLSEDQVIR